MDGHQSRAWIMFSPMYSTIPTNYLCVVMLTVCGVLRSTGERVFFLWKTHLLCLLWRKAKSQQASQSFAYLCREYTWFGRAAGSALFVWAVVRVRAATVLWCRARVNQHWGLTFPGRLAGEDRPAAPARGQAETDCSMVPFRCESSVELHTMPGGRGARQTRRNREGQRCLHEEEEDVTSDRWVMLLSPLSYSCYGLVFDTDVEPCMMRIDHFHMRHK